MHIYLFLREQNFQKLFILIFNFFNYKVFIIFHLIYFILFFDINDYYYYYFIITILSLSLSLLLPFKKNYFILRLSLLSIFLFLSLTAPHQFLIVLILGAIIIDISSWNNNLHAYGISILENPVDFAWHWLHLGELSSTIAMRPHVSHTHTSYLSDTMKSLSLKNDAAPWLTMQSLSISPNLRPPSFALPSSGWWVSVVMGPRALLWILSSTRCLRRW